MIEFSLKDQAPERNEFAGATLGEQHIAPLLDVIQGGEFAEPPGKLVVLSFSGVNSATASYIKATVLALYAKAGAKPAGSDLAGEPEQHFFPVVCDLNDEVSEGIQEVFESRRLFCLEATAMTGDVVEHANVFGAPDAHQIETLLALQELGRATSSELKDHVGSRISTTGWNNRLYDLYRLRLVRRFKRDRQWVYEPVARHMNIKEAVVIA